MKEKIISAAVYIRTDLIRINPPKNRPPGVLFSGKNHNICLINFMKTPNIHKKVDFYEREEGFLTDQNNFLSREEAAQFAYQNGQTQYNTKSLNSADIRGLK